MDVTSNGSKADYDGLMSYSLVLLPGLDGTGVLFRPLIRQLGAEVQPIVVSYPPDKLLGYDELLPTVLAALPCDQPFVLLGESFSGPLALMVAARRPSNLKGIILCASFVQNPVLFRPGWLSHLARPLPFRFFPVLSRLKALLNGDLTNELRALSSEALSQVRPEVLAHRVKAVLQIDVLDQLPHCLYPILYLRGERDYVVPGHNVREIVAARPSVEVVHIQSSHWLLQTQPAAAGAAIMNFVKRVTRRSS